MRRCRRGEVVAQVEEGESAVVGLAVTEDEPQSWPDARERELAKRGGRTEGQQRRERPQSGLMRGRWRGATSEPAHRRGSGPPLISLVTAREDDHHRRLGVGTPGRERREVQQAEGLPRLGGRVRCVVGRSCYQGGGCGKGTMGCGCGMKEEEEEQAVRVEGCSDMGAAVIGSGPQAGSRRRRKRGVSRERGRRRGRESVSERSGEGGSSADAGERVRAERGLHGRLGSSPSEGGLSAGGGHASREPLGVLVHGLAIGEAEGLWC